MMKPVTRTISALFGSLSLVPAVTGCAGPTSDADPLVVHADAVTIAPKRGTPRPPFQFSAADASLLDEIQQATFHYFWTAVSPKTGMVYDRTSSDVISVAGVGFQLAALPVGVERGWITRAQGEARALQILHALDQEPSNRKAGLFYHFINPDDASARRVGQELVVSTVDSALLFSGMLVAGQYFGGQIAHDADRLFAAADWTFFLAEPGGGAPEGRFLSLGWKPLSDDRPTGDGRLLPYYWLDAGDEHRLTTLLGVASPDPAHRVPSSVYWSLRRQLGWHEGQGHMVWFPYSGALFISFFAHLFVDYAALGTDQPGEHAQSHRAKVDWWENARRTVHLHRDRAIANPNRLPTLGPDAWGFSAGDGPEGYLVAGQFPTPVEMVGAQPGRDFSTFAPKDNWGGGVVAPYAMGASIMFEPELAVAALRFARGVTGPNGAPGVWRAGPPEGWGFADAYRLGEDGLVDWVAEDFVAISQGPLLLGIENARTGLVSDLFMAHPAVRAAVERLGLQSPVKTP